MTSLAESLVREIQDLLTVTPAGPDRYVGLRLKEDRGAIFGGEIIGQALAAATYSIEPDRIIHSLHAYFIRPGDIRIPADYQVARDHDGRSFSSRRVTAMQNGEVILNMACSFQRREDGLEHSCVMPDVPPPEGLLSEQDLRKPHLDKIPEAMRDWVSRPRAVEFRPITADAWLVDGPQEPVQQSWVRLSAPIGDDPQLHRTFLAYISDMQLLGTCALPHGLDWARDELRSASLDHTIWFHDDFRVDDWFLFDAVSPWTGGGRGLNHARIFARDGRLVASLAQEGMIRRKRG